MSSWSTCAEELAITSRHQRVNAKGPSGEEGPFARRQRVGNYCESPRSQSRSASVETQSYSL